MKQHPFVHYLAIMIENENENENDDFIDVDVYANEILHEMMPFLEDDPTLNHDLQEVEVGSLPCIFPECAQHFTSDFWLIDHFRIHVGGFPQCPQCMRTFWNQNTLVRHLELHRVHNNWLRRRTLVVSLYGWHGFHHAVNQPLTENQLQQGGYSRATSSENAAFLLASIFGNFDLVRYCIMPFV